MIKQILPAYPLFIADPFFSVWTKHDGLNCGNTMFWNGQERKIYGIVRSNGLIYSFLGKTDGAVKLEQTSVSITAFSTDYEFKSEKFDLSVSFLSPLPPDNLELLSCPVCYMSYNVIFKEKEPGDFSIALIFDEEHCYHKTPGDIRGGVLKTAGYESAYFGLRRQNFMSHSGDSFAADWGYTYLCGEQSFFVSESGLNNYINKGSADYLLEDTERKYLLAVNTSLKSFFMTAFDDGCSINYFGDWLKNYYFSNGKTILDALKYSYNNYDKILNECRLFDEDLQARAKAFGDEYLHVLRASLRQSVGAHKLVGTKSGEVLFLSKECHSNGCIATVDVSYPSTPLYLLYNPVLVEGMLRPIFEFADKPVWEFDFAPHDAGTYPFCCGQTYGLKQNDDKYHAKNIFMRDGNIQENYPMFYMFPSGSDIYEFKYQMPVEECSNMLIMSASLLAANGSKALIESNYQLLRKWSDYLTGFGLVPDNQLCTDDFAGHLDKNVNLSVKAIVGIASFAFIAKKFGNLDDSDKYMSIAKDYSKKWKDMSGGKHTPLSFDNPDSFSLKYNIIFDKLLGFGLFDEELCEKEVDCYLEKMNEFGTPLDSRRDYTKSDWLVWAAALTDNKQKSKKLIRPIYDFLTKSPSRVPFSDWYDTKTAKQEGFQNRTVQGGLFILLLKEKGLVK